MPSSTQQVVIVGRPNVGKSSIFNWLSQRRIAIEDSTAGVTRDRLTQRIECGGKIIDLIDTGGMGFDDPDGLTEQIDMQIEAGLATAGVVVFVVDIRTGRVPADGEVALRLRQSHRIHLLRLVGARIVGELLGLIELRLLRRPLLVMMMLTASRPSPLRRLAIPRVRIGRRLGVGTGRGTSCVEPRRWRRTRLAALLPVMARVMVPLLCWWWCLCHWRWRRHV